MKANPTTSKQILGVLQAYADALAERDIDGMLTLFVDDDDLVIFGSGADERRVGKEALKLQLQRDLAQCESMSMTFQWSAVSAAGKVAWVSTELTIAARINGEECRFPGRYSLVLEEREGRWLFVHSHFSLPASEQPEGHSFPTPG